MKITPRLKHKAPMIIDNKTIEIGEEASIKIQVGRLPSDTTIDIMAHVYRSTNPGPTVLLQGGVHGDEINGIEIVRSLIFEQYLNSINAGTVIAIPLLNVFGFINFSRDVPDGKDVNRSFPGSMIGSLASRVARTLSKKILPYVDLAIDFHTGGASRYNYPQIRYSKKDTIAAHYAEVFGAKYVIQKPTIPKSFRKVATASGISVLVYEAGESVRLCGNSIDIGKEGTLRVLSHLGMYLGEVKKPSEIQHISKTSWVRAPFSGLFRWLVDSGKYVEAGDLLGHIHDPYGNKIAMVKSKHAGHIIGHNNASVVNQGDALFHLGMI